MWQLRCPACPTLSLGSVVRDERLRGIIEDPVDWPYGAVLATGSLACPPVDRLSDCGTYVLEHRRQRGELRQGPHREIGTDGVDTLVEFKADEGSGDCPGEPAEVHEFGDWAASQDSAEHRLDLRDPEAEPGGGRGTEPGVGLRA